MGLKLRDHEKGHDFVIRKGKDNFRLYPISVQATDWVNKDASLNMTTINGQHCLQCTRTALRLLVSGFERLGMNVVGSPGDKAKVASGIEKVTSIIEAVVPPEEFKRIMSRYDSG